MGNDEEEIEALYREIYHLLDVVNRSKPDRSCPERQIGKRPRDEKQKKQQKQQKQQKQHKRTSLSSSAHHICCPENDKREEDEEEEDDEVVYDEQVSEDVLLLQSWSTFTFPRLFRNFQQKIQNIQKLENNNNNNTTTTSTTTTTTSSSRLLLSSSLSYSFYDLCRSVLLYYLNTSPPSTSTANTATNSTAGSSTANTSSSVRSVLQEYVHAFTTLSLLRDNDNTILVRPIAMKAYLDVLETMLTACHTIINMTSSSSAGEDGLVLSQSRKDCFGQVASTLQLLASALDVFYTLPTPSSTTRTTAKLFFLSGEITTAQRDGMMLMFVLLTMNETCKWLLLLMIQGNDENDENDDGDSCLLLMVDILKRMMTILAAREWMKVLPVLVDNDSDIINTLLHLLNLHLRLHRITTNIHCPSSLLTVCQDIKECLLSQHLSPEMSFSLTIAAGLKSDHEVVIDLLVSPETVFLEYLLSFTKHCHWSTVIASKSIYSRYRPFFLSSTNTNTNTNITASSSDGLDGCGVNSSRSHVIIWSEDSLVEEEEKGEEEQGKELVHQIWHVHPYEWNATKMNEDGSNSSNNSNNEEEEEEEEEEKEDVSDGESSDDDQGENNEDYLDNAEDDDDEEEDLIDLRVMLEELVVSLPRSYVKGVLPYDPSLLCARMAYFLAT